MSAVAVVFPPHSATISYFRIVSHQARWCFARSCPSKSFPIRERYRPSTSESRHDFLNRPNAAFGSTKGLRRCFCRRGRCRPPEPASQGATIELCAKVNFAFADLAVFISIFGCARVVRPTVSTFVNSCLGTIRVDHLAPSRLNSRVRAFDSGSAICAVLNSVAVSRLGIVFGFRFTGGG